ncbi:MAG: hypothetical protein F4087_04680 [Gemmatimonadetes bacterium]|nr:hypothetical protein [Gemmatimonadota bacterium]MYE70520.1 hypothetical protein [Gemmatimonadota bacterium]MYJ67797.1 hypothetical protein [Gemmatimonadota bacterium]
MLNRIPALFALCALVTLAGCADEPYPDQAQASSPGTPLEIDAAPTLSVGVVAGDSLEIFDRVVTPFVLPDGRLVVPLDGSRDIRVFTPDGDFAYRLGGPGEGPGEFLSLSAAWPRGDTIEAFDGELRRLTRFLPDGSVTTVPVPGGPFPDMSLGVGPLEEGWALGGVAAGGPGQRDRIEIHHFGRDGGHLGALGSAGGIVRYATAGFGGPEPLSPRSVFASDGTRLYLGDTLEPLIRRVGPAGASAGEIAWEPTEALSVQAALEQVIDRAVARASADQRSATRQRLEGAVVSTELSVFWDFLPDPEGFLWVQPYEPLAHAFALGGTYLGGTAGEGAWRVFTADGQDAGTITIPAGLVVTQIGPSAVVGIHRDDLGVESVRVHRLRRK